MSILVLEDLKKAFGDDLENDQIMALSSSDNRNHTRKVYKKN